MSPVTGVIDERHVVIDFGKHEGRTVQEIFELDPLLQQLAEPHTAYAARFLHIVHHFQFVPRILKEGGINRTG